MVDATIVGVAKLIFSFGETSTAAEPATKSNEASLPPTGFVAPVTADALVPEVVLT